MNQRFSLRHKYQEISGENIFYINKKILHINSEGVKKNILQTN
tara:strand:- start:182 stop:310 length:129 start_codon:yes stop_codon:yes gene_type:complete